MTTSGEPTPQQIDALAQLREQVSDLALVVARQTRTIERLVDATRAPAGPAAADTSLLVDLFALHTDATTCAASASDADRPAFELLRAGLERVIAGRGGVVVSPVPGVEFDARTMEAVDVRTADDAAADRTVAELLRPGLLVGERSVRPAAVVVHRHFVAKDGA
ncbi:nucleotide exchange factor GrpE [Gordonia sp. 'Campus']|uniref:nucleotide exchange factor GrpE n=1 Tax=Gordonia sp. 'Campus' TaxID=2915824 RepID=UPI001EE41B9E|nr:nucleotide exchange factor GrpE [Gordonia sp. 'Campus']